MPTIKKDVIVKNSQGLHARPAAMFVQIASKYDSVVTVEKEGEKVNGRSIMGILTLGAQCGATISLEIEGPDAEALMSELEALLTKEEHQ
jgi:phosphocarrier protein